MRSRPAVYGSRLRAVVQRCAGAMRVNIVDLLGPDLGIGARGAHRCVCRVPIWVWLSQMVRVSASAVSDNFTKNGGFSAAGALEGLQRQHTRPFSQRQSVAVRV